MPKSMTAYGSAEGATVLGHLRIEMRTVNHRFLEISTKLPEDLRPLEPVMRERIGALQPQERHRASSDARQLQLTWLAVREASGR